MVVANTMYIDPEFKELCYEIQNERIKKGLESTKDKMSLERITKMITNMIKNNASQFEALTTTPKNGK